MTKVMMKKPSPMESIRPTQSVYLGWSRSLKQLKYAKLTWPGTAVGVHADSTGCSILDGVVEQENVARYSKIFIKGRTELVIIG